MAQADSATGYSKDDEVIRNVECWKPTANNNVGEPGAEMNHDKSSLQTLIT